jgi:DnaJ-class molecular chaperone
VAKNYYFVLGVNRGADPERIKQAYRRVAKRYHPDMTRTKETADRFLEVKEAYETLANEEKRRQYDQELSEKGSALRINRVPEIIERRTTIGDEMEKVFSATDEFFSGLLPGFFDVDKRTIRAKDLYFEAILSPSEATDGTLVPLSVPIIEPCPQCARSGYEDNFFCPICSGYGRVRSEREFSVSVPPRVKNGTGIRLSMEDIGLRDVYLNLFVRIDPSLDEEW